MGEYKVLAEFYPTPPEIAAAMIGDLAHRKDIKSILEPSAGKGDIIDYFLLARDYLNDSWRYKSYKTDSSLSIDDIMQTIIDKDVIPDFKQGKRCHDRWRYSEIDCIEIDKTLCTILKDKGLRVLNDDFLQFDDDKHYDLIVMNPPFSNGDEHLLKAISLAEKTGSTIRCLLNADTIRNPYSNKRKELLKQLKKYNATYEFIHEGFKNAERKTDVEVVIVKLVVPNQFNGRTSVLDELEENDIQIDEIGLPTELVMVDDELKQAVKQYKKEIMAGKKAIEVFLSLKPYFNSKFETGDKFESSQYGNLILCNDMKNGTLDWNKFVYDTRLKYWKGLLGNAAFLGNLTSNLITEYRSMIAEFAHKDFSLRNIYIVKMDILRRLSKGIEDRIVSLFEELSYKHSMDAAGNVHLFSGWKSNSAFKINQRIVLPYVQVWDSIFGKFRYYQLAETLNDIEKCLDFLDMGNNAYTDKEVRTCIKDYESKKQTKKMSFKHFDVDIFKKGTAHIRFRDPELLKRFNLYGCQHKGWLPPSYGKKSYREMTEEEKQVVDSYEGEQEYNKVYMNPDKYILAPEKMLLLSSGE